MTRSAPAVRESPPARRSLVVGRVVLSPADRIATTFEEFLARGSCERLVTREGVCGQLDCGETFFYEHVERHLVQYREGSAVRYTESSVNDYIASRLFTADGQRIHKRKARRKP